VGTAGKAAATFEEINANIWASIFMTASMTVWQLTRAANGVESYELLVWLHQLLSVKHFDLTKTSMRKDSYSCRCYAVSLLHIVLCMLRLICCHHYIQHKTTGQGAHLLVQDMSNERLLGSHHTITCHSHRLGDKWCMLRHAD
jgi:hypothetical protein